MWVKSIYDTQHPDATHTIETLLLLMVGNDLVEVGLPNGDFAEGMIRDVKPLFDGRLVEVTSEINDCFASLYYINHNAQTRDLVTSGTFTYDMETLEPIYTAYDGEAVH